MERATEPGGDLRSAILRTGGALVCLAAFWGMSRHYGGFQIPYGFGIQEIHPAELVFSLWYLVLGLPAVWLVARALDATRVPEYALSALTRIGSHPRLVLAAAALAAGLVALAIRAWVLQFAPIADDESTYVFIARTLLEGRVANPSPGDVAFFRNQFVVLDDATWYGKYPIGHPLVLAAGEALGLRALVAPALTAASLVLTFAVGRQVLPAPLALLGTGLLLISPQFLFTGGTELSQTSSGLCLLVTLWGLLRLDAGGSLRFAALAGVALGFGLLVRPLPGILFLAVAGLWVLMRFRSEPASRQIQRIAAGLVPVLFFGALFLMVQTAQTGDPTQSGYDVYHGGSLDGLFQLEFIAASIFGALLRQNLWLFGWPLSFLFLPFARRNGRTILLWSMILAEYAYRVILPKTVVASTGPIYVAEIVPLLALLSASGMAEVARFLASLGVDRGRERAAAALLIGDPQPNALRFFPIPGVTMQGMPILPGRARESFPKGR